MPCGEGFIRNSTPYYWLIKNYEFFCLVQRKYKWTYWDQKRFTWPQSTFVVQIANRFRATTFPLLNSQKKICVVEYDILLIPLTFFLSGIYLRGWGPRGPGGPRGPAGFFGAQGS